MSKASSVSEHTFARNGTLFSFAPYVAVGHIFLFSCSRFKKKKHINENTQIDVITTQRKRSFPLNLAAFIGLKVCNQNISSNVRSTVTTSGPFRVIGRGHYLFHFDAP